VREIDKTYNIYDGTIGIWRINVDAEVLENYDAIRMMMMNDGWTFHQDPAIKKHYSSLADTHHAGKKRDICFLSSVTGRHIEFKFYEPVIRDNSNGGQYTMNKMEKMPYLLRLQVTVAINRVVAILGSLGFTDKSKIYPIDGLAAIMKCRAELEDFQGKDFYQRERSPYNCTDADGVQMHDGDVRYFRTWTGHLQRGVVYRNINNVWWVHTGPYSYTTVANFDLFTWKSATGGRRKFSQTTIEKKQAALLDAAVKAQNFERAIVLRDLIKGQAA
jgi:hypothetical protein